MKNLCIIYFIVLMIVMNVNSSNDDEFNYLSITIKATTLKIEVAWKNIENRNGYILLTDFQPTENFLRGNNKKQILNTNDHEHETVISYNITNNDHNINNGIIVEPDNISNESDQWFYSINNDNEHILYTIKVENSNGWITTDSVYSAHLSRQINLETKCYGFWISHINQTGAIINTNCLKAYPTWMNDMHDIIENYRIRSLYIPGTHDSASYPDHYDPTENETIVTKYSITQDEDITGQLMHGIRYLDIRVGYYKFLSTKFWGNHGISRQQPLYSIFKQVRQFVLDTNEIVILDIQEFPVGFGKNLAIHRKLVQLIERELGDIMINATLTWHSSLKDMWDTQKNVIVSYDHKEVVNEYPNLLFRSVEQKWGNVQSLSDLNQYLTHVTDNSISTFYSRPYATMAELTPLVWGVITDSYGGLRKMADGVNKHVSYWYSGKWGKTANIVAVDFFRSTNIVESALYWNSKKNYLTEYGNNK